MSTFKKEIKVETVWHNTITDGEPKENGLYLVICDDRFSIKRFAFVGFVFRSVDRGNGINIKTSASKTGFYCRDENGYIFDESSMISAWSKLPESVNEIYDLFICEEKEVNDNE